MNNMKNSKLRNAEYQYWVFFNASVKWGGLICVFICGTMAAMNMVDWFELNGPSDIKSKNPDEVMQLIVLGFPLLFGLFGWLLFRAKPYFPKKFHKSDQE